MTVRQWICIKFMTEVNREVNGEHIFIVRCGEVALKGMNKPYFERMLVERIKKLLKKFDGVSVKRHEGLIFVRADGNLDKQAIGVWSGIHQSGGRM